MGQTDKGGFSDESHIRAVLRLHLAEHVGAVTYKKLIEAFGSAERAIEVGQSGWERVSGIGPAKALAIAAVSDQQVDEELAAAAKMGAVILTQEDPRVSDGAQERL